MKEGPPSGLHCLKRIATLFFLIVILGASLSEMLSMIISSYMSCSLLATAASILSSSLSRNSIEWIYCYFSLVLNCFDVIIVPKKKSNGKNITLLQCKNYLTLSIRVKTKSKGLSYLHAFLT